MSAARALARLRDLGKAVVTTADAALVLGATPSAASRTLARLAKSGLAQRIRHGLWTLEDALDPLRLPEYLTAPLPSYVSLQSALFLHGMIDQIPQVIYVASLAPTRRVRTRLGTFSIHRIGPRFFGGYSRSGPSGAWLATPEKALLDTLYLAPARSRLFASLPEIELSRGFSARRARKWLQRLPAGPRRIMVTRRLEAILAEAPSDGKRNSRTSPR